ncbi:unnamed protein product [Chrysoparadoxa australica]
MKIPRALLSKRDNKLDSKDKSNTALSSSEHDSEPVGSSLIPDEALDESSVSCRTSDPCNDDLDLSISAEAWAGAGIVTEVEEDLDISARSASTENSKRTYGHSISSSFGSFRSTSRSNLLKLFGKRPASEATLAGTSHASEPDLRLKDEYRCPVQQVSSASLRGPKHRTGENEDRMLCIEDVFAGCPLICSKSMSLLGVFDGHGGPDCAHFCCEHIAQYFRESSSWADLRGEGAGNVEVLEKAVVLALEECVGKIQDVFLEKAGAEADTSGTCVLLAVVCGGMVVFANLGDSQAMLYEVKADGTEVLRSTTMHRYDNPSERARVMAAGGHFTNGRLLGCLVPTRCLGDLDVVKACPGGLGCVPQCQVVHRSSAAGGTAMLLLASDGMWDSLMPQIVAKRMKIHAKKQKRSAETLLLAEDLALRARKAGSDDDITVVCGMLA